MKASNDNRVRRRSVGTPVSPPRSCALLGVAGVLATILAGSVPVSAQTGDSWPRFNPVHRRDNGSMMRLVRPLTEPLEQSVVQVLSGGRPVALATVVSEDGYCVTKRSELSGDPIRVRLSDGKLFPARVAAVRRGNDLALLRIDTDIPLTPVEFCDDSCEVGRFLISAGRGGRPIGLGVVGVPPRPISHTGRLGVFLAAADVGGAIVQGIWPGSGAERAGLEPGDRILAINGEEQPDRARVMDTLHAMYPGEIVRLTLERGGSTLDVDAQMRDSTVMQESPNDAKVNGRRNRRLSGFEQAIQHDTVLSPEECGGPVLDADGRVVGLNIARAGRVVSYALPATVVAKQTREMLAEVVANSN